MNATSESHKKTTNHPVAVKYGVRVVGCDGGTPYPQPTKQKNRAKNDIENETLDSGLLRSREVRLCLFYNDLSVNPPRVAIELPK